MGTASGFFGITYQGAVNGLASQTLSIFNMVRRVITAIACPVCQRVLAPPAQDHPIDRCWCKTVFDYVCPEAVDRTVQGRPGVPGPPQVVRRPGRPG